MSERNLRKTRVGVVSSDKMDKTVVVSIKDKVRHPLYGKIINRTVKYKAHDEENTCGVGDKVLIMETRPMTAVIFFKGMVGKKAGLLSMFGGIASGCAWHFIFPTSPYTLFVSLFFNLLFLVPSIAYNLLHSKK